VGSFSRRILFTSLWFYSLFLFIQSSNELIQNITKVSYWESLWRLVLPIFFVFGVLGLAIFAAFITGDRFQAGNKILIYILSIQKRIGWISLVLAVFVILLATFLVIENPWPWVFRWPHTRRFILLYSGFVSIFFSYPWLRRINSFVWRKLDQIQLRAESLFLGLAAVFGLVYILLIPPFMAPDEFAHLYRSWAISELVLFQDHATLPVSFNPVIDVFLQLRSIPSHKVDFSQVFPLFQQPLQANSRKEVSFVAAGVYPPFVYFPQAVGIAFARILNLSPLLVYYSGRLVNYLAWVLLAWASLRITPVYKWVFLILLFIPMSFYQAVSISPDVMTNGSAFLFAAIIIRLVSDETALIQPKMLFWLFGAAILVSLTKIPYFLLTLTFFIIPLNKFGSKKKYLSTVILFLFVILVVVSLANMQSFLSFLSIDQVRKVPPFSQRLSEIIADPINFGHILYNTIKMRHEFLFYSFLGRLGWLEIILPYSVYTAIFLVLIINILVDGARSFTISWRTRLWIMLLSFGIPFIITVLLYFSFTRDGLTYVNGLQGRYFIPISPFAALLMYNQKLVDLGKYIRWISLFYLVWLFIEVASVIAIRFYTF
jgi:uncharacterized membrane protein